MELLESQDPERKKLLELSERHRKELQREITDISQRTERVLTNALIVGGVLAISYFAVTQFTKSRSKKKKHKKALVEQAELENSAAQAVETEEASVATPSLLSGIGTKIMNQATMILIQLAREKLMEYMENRKKNDAA